jgi:hypothetical protein
MSTSNRYRLALFAWGALYAALALAHHSFTATYLLDQQIRIEGTIVQMLFRNPHSFIHVIVLDSAGNEQRWAVEWSGAAGLTRGSVSNTTLAPGDKVIVVGNPGRNPEDHRMLVRSIVRPSDGWSWTGTFQ